ncbi:hypothetical protein Tco_1316221 [Tanacetum coccineum]
MEGGKRTRAPHECVDGSFENLIRVSSWHKVSLGSSDAFSFYTGSTKAEVVRNLAKKPIRFVAMPGIHYAAIKAKNGFNAFRIAAKQGEHENYDASHSDDEDEAEKDVVASYRIK